MIGKIFVVLLSSANAFQLCENPADYDAAQVYAVTCSGASFGDETKCKAHGDGFGWESNACLVQFSPTLKAGLKETCEAKGGTASGEKTCGWAIPVYFPGLTPTKAECKVMNAPSGGKHSNAYYTSYAGGIMGCCKGGTPSVPKDLCTKLDPPFPMCENAADFKAAHVYQVECKGIVQGSCTKTGMTWDDGKCQIKPALGAVGDLVKICTDNGGSVGDSSQCGVVSKMYLASAGSQPSEAACSSSVTVGSSTMKVSLLTDYIANREGCCAGATTIQPKDSCHKFKPKPTFRLCSNETSWAPNKVVHLKCLGVAQGACTGTGFSWKGNVCEVAQQSNGQDLCKAKGGTPAEVLTCTYFTDNFFPNPMKADAAGCAANDKDGNLIKNRAKTYGDPSWGCCDSKADCCNDPTCDGSITVTPPAVSRGRSQSGLLSVAALVAGLPAAWSI